MTREEKISEEGRKYATHLTDTDRTDFYGNYDNEMQYNANEHRAFIAGARWADAHPKSPWISVEDKLPYEYPELLEGRYKDTTVPVLTKTDRLGYFIQYMYYIGHSNTWEFYEGGGVSHWMPIPKLPE